MSSKKTTGPTGRVASAELLTLTQAFPVLPHLLPLPCKPSTGQEMPKEPALPSC